MKTLKIYAGDEADRMGFRAQLAEQRWDDHRFYHHSLINQSLHFVSATTFLTAYVLLFSDPALASLLAWGVAMTSRQAGHFFFEPKGYDHVNEATHSHKEAIKVGYNLFRKVVLMTLWALSPIILFFTPTLFGFFPRPQGQRDVVREIGYLWLVVGGGGLLFRTVHLFYLRDIMSGLVWATKIVTDPLNDFMLYRRAPLRLLKGERLDHGYGH